MDQQNKKPLNTKSKPLLSLVPNQVEEPLAPSAKPSKSRLAAQLQTFADQLDKDIDFWLKL